MSTVDAIAADRVVVVTATAGYRHESIETAERVLGEMARPMGVELVRVRTEKEMEQALSPEGLRSVRLLMFINTTGEIAPSIRTGVLEWVAAGGAFAGFHSASDTWHDSPHYIEMLGAEFDRHPEQLAVDLLVDEPGHPATSGLDSPQRVFEEIYLFRQFRPESVRLLISLRMSPEDGSDGIFPISWTRNYGKGRVFYSALGHRSDIWTSAWFQKHLSGAILWGLRRDVQPRRRAVKR
ncbi:MAG TPA: ThuA domain-containing protein [Thermoanaerobaculia bacterium]|nr:ThuA domain-containing protein [Thermoanaerobaculia bacterium]